MADDTFVQDVKITGLREILDLFDAIGKAGESAFVDVEKAARDAGAELSDFEKQTLQAASNLHQIELSAEAFGNSIRNVGDAASDFADSLADVGQRITYFVGAVTAAVTGLTYFVGRTINSIDSMSEQAEALGLSTEAFQQYRYAAIAGGATAAQFAQGFGRVNQLISKGVTESNDALLKFAEAVKNQPKKLGVIENPYFGRDIAREFNLIRDAAKKVASETGQPFFKVEEALRKLVESGAAGRQEFEKITGVALPPLKDGLERLRAGAEKSGNELVKLGIPLKDLQGKARPLNDVIQDIAKKLGEIENPAERAAAATRLFGRAGPLLANAFGKGTDKLKGFLDEAKKFGFFLGDEAVKDAQAAQGAVDLLGLAVGNLKDRFAVAFARPLAAGATGLTSFIAENQKAFDDLANRVSDFVIPIVKDFFALLVGQGVSQQNQWLVELRDGLVTVADVIKTKVVTAFRVLKTAADGIASAINFIFGTKVSGGVVAATIAVTALTGGFRLLFNAVRLGIALFTPFIRLFTLVTTAAGATGAAGAIGVLLSVLNRFIIPAALIAGIIAIVSRFESIPAAAQAAAESINSFFGGANVASASGVIEAITAIGAALILLRTRALQAGAALLGISAPALVAGLLVVVGLLAELGFAASGGAQKMGEMNAEFRKVLEDFETHGDQERLAREWDAVADKFSRVGAAADGAGESMKDAGQKGSDAAKKVETEWRETSKGVWEKVDRESGKAAGSVESQWASASKGVLNFAKRTSDEIKLTTEQAQEAVDSLRKDIERVFGPEATEGAKEAIRGIKSPIEDLATFIREGASGAVDYFTGRIDESRTKADAGFLAMGTAIDTNVIQPLNRAIEKLQEFLRTMPTEPVTPQGGEQTPGQVADTEIGGRRRSAFEEQGGLETLDTTTATTGMNALTAATNIAREAIEQFKQSVASVGEVLATMVVGITTGVDGLGLLASALGAAGNQADQAKQQFAGIGEALSQSIGQAVQNVGTLLSDLVTQIGAGISDLVSQIGERLSEVTSTVQSSVQSMVQSISNALDQLMAKLDAAIAKAKELAAAVASAGGGGGDGGDSGEGFAGGGVARGPSGVDKVPAWVTAGEWIINKDSSRKYGAILRAINDGTFKMPRFNLGGVAGALASSMRPLKFAGGGAVPTMTGGGLMQVDLNFGGGNVFHLMGQRSAVDELSDFAVHKRTSRTGRRPRGGG